MNRISVLSALAAHIPYDAEESAHLTQTRTFVERNPAFYDKNHTPGHVTASAWIVNPACTQVLLTHHRKLDRWFQLGGHLENDADLLGGALREALEESGLMVVTPWKDSIFDVDVHPIPAKGEQPAHLHYDVRYAFHADPRAPLVISGESRDLRWVTLDKVSGLSNEASLRRMIAKTPALGRQRPR